MTSRVLVSIRVNAAPARAFEAFTAEIGQWWQPNSLFILGPRPNGRLQFEQGKNGRLIEIYDDGTRFEIGAIRLWEPPHRLVVAWRQASFAPDQETELHVSFDPVGEQTRVTVEHFGWDTIPAPHAARHGFPLSAFQARFAEWWQALLRNLATQVSARPQS